MRYLDAPKIHGVISSALYNKIASYSPLNDVPMSPEVLPMYMYMNFVLRTLAISLLITNSIFVY